MTDAVAKNLTWHPSQIGAAEREARFGQRGCVLWFTGLSGAGKSTLATALEVALVRQGRFAYVLDGDNVRHGLNRDLGFSASDRVENIRRVGEVAALFANAGVIALTAFISPYRREREAVRQAVGRERFVEILVAASLEVCEARDPKGLYRKARAGEIAEFTGISAPYETPEHPELVIDTGRLSVEESVGELLRYLSSRRFLHPHS